MCVSVSECECVCVCKELLCSISHCYIVIVVSLNVSVYMMEDYYYCCHFCWSIIKYGETVHWESSPWLVSFIWCTLNGSTTLNYAANPYTSLVKLTCSIITIKPVNADYSNFCWWHGSCLLVPFHIVVEWIWFGLFRGGTTV